MGVETEWSNFMSRGEAQVLKVRMQNCSMKVENVSLEGISLINLNNNRMYILIELAYLGVVLLGPML